jgi:mannose-6-phosphate isomerase-like protein (cupin superfamily)
MIQGLDIHEFTTPGYKPLVYSSDWMVALLNYDDSMAYETSTQIERHVHTDEVFILLAGQAAFYLLTDDQTLQVVELKPGLIYNVYAGTWHGLLATPEASFAIVENRDTNLFDTELRPLTQDERQSIFSQLPAWAK